MVEVDDGIARDMNALETLRITTSELRAHRKDPLGFLQEKIKRLNEPPKEAGDTLTALLPALLKQARQKREDADFASWSSPARKAKKKRPKKEASTKGQMLPRMPLLPLSLTQQARRKERENWKRMHAAGHTITINVTIKCKGEHVKGDVLPIRCKGGRQTAKWLGITACQRYLLSSVAHGQIRTRERGQLSGGFILPSDVSKVGTSAGASGKTALVQLSPDVILRDVFKDGDHAIVEFTTELGGAGLPPWLKRYVS
jgi:hypothetical protein